MRLLVAALLVIVLPPTLAGLVAFPFGAVYLFAALYIGISVVVLPLSGSIGTGLAITPCLVRSDLMAGLVWAGWFAAALLAFYALHKFALLL